ncbi:MAG: hypothetical protein ACTSSD_19515 [Candidatus Thorarchaeota archaeon]
MVGIEKLVERFFRGLDGIVDDLLENQQDDLLTSIRDVKHIAHNTLRPNMGNADGWPWISEYMIFHVFRRTIEREIGSEFEAESLSPKLCVFVNPEKEFTLGHGIAVKQLLKGSSGSSDKFWNLKPDVCLVYRNRIILTVEVKTAVRDKEELIEAFNKLARIQKRSSQKPRSRAFFVSYAPSLRATPDKDVVRAYRDFYIAKGRYVGRFDHKSSSLTGSDLFKVRDVHQRKMKLLKLEDCLGKVRKLLGKLPS